MRLYNQILCYTISTLGDSKVYFVEVGANIGAFMVDIVRRSNVYVFVFEPSKSCVQAIRKTMKIDKRENYTVFQNLVCETEEMV